MHKPHKATPTEESSRRRFGISRDEIMPHLFVTLILPAMALGSAMVIGLSITGK